jgi:hemerythrin-like domain-containing protein
MRAAAKATPAEQLVQASAFVDFFATETSPHFRGEEELLRALDAQLREQLSVGAVLSTTMRQLGELLERHIHAEERELFPLIERTASEAELSGLEQGRKRATE